MEEQLSSNTSFNTELFKFGVGVIHQYINHKGYYIVHVNGGFKQAVTLGSTGYIGTTESNSYEVGAKVLYLVHPDLPCAYIMAQWPDHFPGQVTCQRKPRILRELPSEDDPVWKPDRADEEDHEIVSGPLVPHGQSSRDFHRSTALGGLLSLGLEGLIARASHSSGLEATESTTHVFGEQLFLSSFSSAVKEFRNKYGQDTVRHVFKALHECFGYPESSELGQINSTENSSPYDKEIRYRDPIPTVSYYEGDSSDGQTRIVRVYDDEDTKYSDEVLEIEGIQSHKMIPVFKEVLYKDGSYRLQSATEIAIEKYSIINDPTIKRLNPDEYEEEQGYQDELSFEYSDDLNYSPMASLGLCYHAFIFEHLYFKKYKDRWERRSSGEIQGLLTGIQSAIFNKPDFRKLPDIHEIIVDQEHDIKRKIYGSRSGIYFHDDGTVSIESGWGSQIVLGSDITLTPARDLLFRPGCDAAFLVPGEISLVGKKNINLAADDGSISISCDSFINIQQTNETEGAVYIRSFNRRLNIPESEREKPVGVVIRSDGLISSMSERTHELNKYKLLSSEVFDCTLSGGSNFNIRANNLSYFRHPISSAVGDGNIDLTPEDSPVLYISNGNLRCRGGASFEGEFTLFGNSRCLIEPNITLGGSINSRSSAVFTSVSENADPERERRLDEIIELAFESHVDDIERHIETDNNILSIYYEPFIEDGYGNNSLIRELRFAAATLRETPFEFFETRWQQYLDGGDTWAWESAEDLRAAPKVLTNKAKLHILVDSSAYVSQEGVFVDEAELPSEDDLEELEDIENNYVISTGQENYRPDIYDDDD